MNKRGFLLAEETLKIILALIGISFLVFFLTSLYFTNLNQKALEQAQQILKDSKESVQKIISNLNEGEERVRDLDNPKGWSLFSFVDEKPNSCAGQSCICICDGASFFESQVEECTDKGICLVVENLASFSEIEIKSPELTKILIKKDSGKIFVRETE